MSQAWRRGPGLGSCSPLRRLITWGEGRQDRQVSKWRCHHMVCLYCPLSFPQQTWILHCVPNDGASHRPSAQACLLGRRFPADTPVSADKRSRDNRSASGVRAGMFRASFVQSSETPSKEQEPLARPISWHQTACSSDWRNSPSSEGIGGGGAAFEDFRVGALFGNFSEQRHFGPSAMFLLLSPLLSSPLM